MIFLAKFVLNINAPGWLVIPAPLGLGLPAGMFGPGVADDLPIAVFEVFVDEGDARIMMPIEGHEGGARLLEAEGDDLDDAGYAFKRALDRVSNAIQLIDHDDIHTWGPWVNGKAFETARMVKVCLN